LEDLHVVEMPIAVRGRKPVRPQEAGPAIGERDSQDSRTTV
jgi:hypothetical protein